MLQPYRVLDLCDDRGHAAGFLLAQLGAEVIAVEPVAGLRSRHVGPFVDEAAPTPDSSLEHWAYGRGKRSVVIPEDAEGDETLRALVATADVILECGARVLDLDALRTANPGLVTLSFSNFGSDGPKADWLGTDLTLAASSGQVALTGDSDRAPVRISEPQVWTNAGSEAACAVLIALTERHRSGLGQHVDVSAQEAMMLSTQGWMSPALCGAASVQRLAGGASLLGGLKFRFVYACADGHVTISFLPGVMVGPFTNRLLAWCVAQGHGDAALLDYDWVSLADDYPLEHLVDVVVRSGDVVAAAVAGFTKAELFALAKEQRFLLVPVATALDVLDHPHYGERDAWDEVDVAPLVPDSEARPDPRPVRFPGPYASSVGAPLTHLGRPPLLGEHTEELAALLQRQTAPLPLGRDAAADNGALAGLKVVDLTWVYAGPFATRMLGYHGATVVRVESTTRPDQVRSSAMPRSGNGGAEDSMQWHAINADKLSVQVNLSVPEGREVLLDLARWADVLIEAFAPGVIERMGLGPDVLAEANPQLISVSTSLFGHDGSLSYIPGFGNMGAAMGGFYEVTGWPDRLPAGPYLAYTDATSPRLTAAVILAALDDRRRTGRGAHIDFAQNIGGLHFLTRSMVEAQMSGRAPTRRGNADPSMSPHGIHPSAGNDQWIAIACETDGQWQALCGVLGRQDLAELTVTERRAQTAQIDEAVASWTAQRSGATAQEALQLAGVPAHRVQNSPECVEDPQLIHRRHFVEIPHPEHGHSWADQYGFRLSRTPGGPRRAGPTWGEHNEEVLVGMLGYDDDRIAELAIAGVLE